MKLKGSCHCQSVHFEVESFTPYPFMYCYCSICRKTAGGSGSAINIMAEANTLKVKGMKQVQIYHAIMGKKKNGRKIRSNGQRHFCKHCASCLWIFDPNWPQWIYPFASAIDTPLPKAPERNHVLLASAAKWCEILTSKQDLHFKQFPHPEESIEEWHKHRGLYKKN